MKLTDFIPRKAIVLQLRSEDKKGVVRELVQVIKDAHVFSKFQTQEVVDAVLAREKLGSTGLGSGVAIPHAKITYTKTVVGALGRSAKGIQFDAVDGEPVHTVFLILLPAQKADEHLLALQKTVQAVKHPNFCKFLKNVKTAKEVEELLEEVDQEITV